MEYRKDFRQITDALAAKHAGTKAHTDHALLFLTEQRDIPEAHLTAVTHGCAAMIVLCHMLAKSSGWWDNEDATDPKVFATKIALIHSEVSEALEGGRKGLQDEHLSWRRAEEVELADTLIRIFDLAGARRLDLCGALVEKLAYNQTRADHSRAARAAAGGKKF